ncbi:MAG: formylglycine-generating enzyme family protein, partial [Gammaproteobacteria bacterium]
MSWREPSDRERGLLEDARSQWPELLPYARVLALAPRVEPLLLRNARQHYLPHSGPDLESLFWFSPLVAGRGGDALTLFPGVCRLLLEERAADRPWLKALWEFTRSHTRHWPRDRRIERDLRYFSLIGDDAAVGDQLRTYLAALTEAPDDDSRINFAYSIKRSLADIGVGPNHAGETHQLSYYAARALGDGGDWGDPGDPELIPNWLHEHLPDDLPGARLGVELRGDGVRSQVLHFIEAESGGDALEFSSPLPARLYVAPENRAGQWHGVAVGSRIPIDPPAQSLRLANLDGRSWTLRAEEGVSGEALNDPGKPAHDPLLLWAAKDDAELAERLADWLRAAGHPVELIYEQLPETTATKGPGPRLVRLWTDKARGLWSGESDAAGSGGNAGLILKLPGMADPALGGAGGAVLTLPESLLSGDPNPTPDAQWLAGFESRLGAPDAANSDEDLEKNETDAQAERRKLLAKLDDPATEPPERLAIGDRLAELGDDRPGVGVIQVALDEHGVIIRPGKEAADAPKPKPTPPRKPPPRYTPGVQALLDEIADPATEPPRRLEIGDELAKRGDPRPGVGLRDDSLPDIDWVAIPAGTFRFQRGEELEREVELPTFWISRHPVTNAQFQAFVEAGGYGDEALWKDLKRPQPKISHWDHPNRPRTDVDWYEAMAYARWLSRKLTGDTDRIRLPTEIEWERVAGGRKNREYPWGDGYESGFANLNEKRAKAGPWFLEQTTAVGLYPQGANPEGVLDLAGQV